MPDYRKLYFTLFHGITDAILILQQAQQTAEALYMNGEEPQLQVLEFPCSQADSNQEEHDV